MTQETLETIKASGVRNVSIICIQHPEWGTFGVMEDNGRWFDICNHRGGRILSYDEALRFWEVA